MYTDIFIQNKIGEAEHGDVVLVTLEDWPKKPILLWFCGLKVLGKPGRTQYWNSCNFKEYVYLMIFQLK